MDMEDIRGVSLEYICRSGSDIDITSDADDNDFGPLVLGSPRTSPPMRVVPVKIHKSSGVWCVHVQDAYVSKLGRLWATKTANGTCKEVGLEGCTYTRLATALGLDSGPDAVRVVVVVSRIQGGVVHNMPPRTSEPVSRFLLPQIQSASGRAAASKAATFAGDSLTIANIRKTWAALREWPIENKVRYNSRAHDGSNRLFTLGMGLEDMKAILAVYGMCTEDYHIMVNVGMHEASAQEVIPTIATSSAGNVWAVRAPSSTLQFWLARMDDDEEGVDESSELAKQFVAAKHPGYCPTLRTGNDSGPDAIRVVVALHRVLNSVPTKLPNSTSTSEVHALHEGGIVAHNTRLGRRTSNPNIDTSKGLWHSMSSTSVPIPETVDESVQSLACEIEKQELFNVFANGKWNFQCVREIEREEAKVICTSPLRETRDALTLFPSHHPFIFVEEETCNGAVEL